MTDDDQFSDALQHPHYTLGTQLPSLPLVKLARAREHQASLYSQVAVWQATCPAVAKLKLSDNDPTVVCGYLHIVNPPPVLVWSVIFGDAVHNCRSALDSMIWAFATMGGAKPRHPNRVQFPVTTRAAQFNEFAETALETLPRPVIERLRLLQPFVNEDSSKVSGLSILQKFSNADKHRSPIFSRPVAFELSVSARLTYLNHEDAGDFGTRPLEVNPDFSGGLVDGLEVLRLQTHAPLSEATGEMLVKIEPFVELTPGGPVVSLRVALEAILRAADDAIRVISGGVVPANDPRADRDYKPMSFTPLTGPALEDWRREMDADNGGPRPS